MFKAKNPNQKKLFKIILVLIVAVVLYSIVSKNISWVGGFPMLKKSKAQITERPLEQPPVPVKVYKAARVNFRDTLPALGTVKGFREFDLKFPVSGNVEYINFREGEKITQGDIIASLDQKEALLKLEYAKVELDKQSKLFELGSIVDTKLKQSQLEYQSAKAELDKTNLVALADGYVGSIEVDKGSFVSPQDKVGTFVDMRDIYAEFGIIEKDVAKLKEGQNLELVVDSYPDQVFKGEIDSVSPIVEGRSRTVRVRGKLSNTDERVKPGMFGRVNVLVYEKEDALIIPTSAFKKKEDQYIVYVVHQEEAPAPVEGGPEINKKKSRKKKGQAESQIIEEPKRNLGTVELRTIEVQYATPDAIEVKEGIEEGETIVADLEQDLADKARVEITETQEGIF